MSGIGVCGGAIFGVSLVASIVAIFGFDIQTACTVAAMVMGLIVAIGATFASNGKGKKDKKRQKYIDKEEHL
jgi:hypothetical protein